MTTIASFTTIPKASKKANKTIKFNVNPNAGSIIKAIHIDNGTDMATKMASVSPIKNIRINVTRINPMIIVLIKSCKVTRVARL